MKLIARLENCAQVSSFCSITVVRSLQTTSISYYSGPNTSILTICGHRSGGERLIRVAVIVFFSGSQKFPILIVLPAAPKISYFDLQKTPKTLKKIFACGGPQKHPKIFFACGGPPKHLKKIFACGGHPLMYRYQSGKFLFFLPPSFPPSPFPPSPFSYSPSLPPPFPTPSQNFLF